MRQPTLFLTLLLAAGQLFAGELYQDAKDAKITPGSPWKFSFELESGYSYVGGADTGHRDIDEQSSNTEFVMTARYKESAPLRFGVNWQRFSFGSTEETKLPNTLQGISFVVGVDFQLFDNFFFRLEAQPGWYSGSNEILGRAFNVPVVLGGSYLVNKDLQFILGLSFDAQREYPVLLGGGVRWQINEHWLANVVLPKPRLEYKVSDALTLYVGGEIFESTYRVDGDLGHRTNTPKLNNAWLEYVEVRGGAGVMLHPSENVTVNLEAGYMAYRGAEYERADVLEHSKSGAPYGGVSLKATF